jgi:two-component system sensor histidine kinase YesM
LHNTIFIKLLGTYMLIMTPVMIFGVYIYQWNIKATKNDILETAQAQISFYLSDLESEIERMKLLQYGVLDDTNLNKLALLSVTMDMIERTEKINELRNRLHAIENSSDLIKDVSAHIYPIAKTISSSQGAQDLELERYLAIQSAFHGKGAQIIEVQDGLVLSAISQFGSQSDLPVFIVDIELDTNKLRKSLRKLNTYQNSGTILLTESTDGILIEGTDEFLDMDLTAAVELAKRFSPNRPGPDRSERVEIDDQSFYIAFGYSDYLKMSVYRFIPEAVVREPLERLITWAWLFIAAALALTGIYVFSIHKFIHKPLLTLVKSFRRLEHGDFDFSIAHASNDEFRYLYMRFNYMVSNLRSLINQVYRQKILKQRAELKQLQSQINPHFLYNSFFILNTMARTGDLERIEQLTTMLGEYFRFVTRNAADMVELQREIHHAKMYTEIQAIRFSHRIRIQFADLPPHLMKIRVPRLIVQPIIENAFEHSLEKMASDGLMVISFADDGTQVRIIIEDNGRQLTDEHIRQLEIALMDNDEYRETTAMINIHRRLRIVFGEEGGLKVGRSPLGGLKVELHFPLRRENVDVPDAHRG